MFNLRWIAAGVVLLGCALLMLQPAAAQETEPERGAYVAEIAGCAYCHSPAEGPAFSGAEFERSGVTYYAPNLTPASTGLGGWTADEIRRAITTGRSRHGRQLHPVMPYLYYNRMADSDLDALVSYLGSRQPVEADPMLPNDLSAVTLPPAPQRASGVEVPDPADTIAYGEYLTEAVMACGSCHTPTLDSGLPDPTLHLAGGEPFDGEWGTVYATNLTPHGITGSGDTPDDSIILAVTNGRHSARRPVYAMPWQAYRSLSGRDAEAMLAYLRSIDPVFNEIPPADLREEYPATQTGPPSIWNVLTTVLMLLALVGLVVYLTIRQYRQAQRVRSTDWEGHFRDVLSEAHRREREAGSRRDSDQE